MWYQITSSHTSTKSRRAAVSAPYLVSARMLPARFGVETHKATVFEGDCPAAPIIRCMNLPNAGTEAATENGGTKIAGSVVPITPCGLEMPGITGAVNGGAICH